MDIGPPAWAMQFAARAIAFGGLIDRDELAGRADQVGDQEETLPMPHPASRTRIPVWMPARRSA